VLIDYYVYRELLNFSFFWDALEDVFEGGLEGMGEGIDLGIGCFEKLQSLVAAAVSSIRIARKVAEEMLLCEVIVQRNACQSQHHHELFMMRECL
jgi:hypothetical protein